MGPRYVAIKICRAQIGRGFECNGESVATGKRCKEQGEAFKGLAALNMLNTKYLIYDKQAAPFMNMHRYGAAWLADSVVMVSDAAAAIGEVMRREDLKRVAVVEESFSEEVAG